MSIGITVSLTDFTNEVIVAMNHEAYDSLPSIFERHDVNPYDWAECIEQATTPKWAFEYGPAGEAIQILEANSFSWMMDQCRDEEERTALAFNVTPH